MEQRGVQRVRLCLDHVLSFYYLNRMAPEMADLASKNKSLPLALERSSPEEWTRGKSNAKELVQFLM